MQMITDMCISRSLSYCTLTAYVHNKHDAIIYLFIEGKPFSCEGALSNYFVMFYVSSICSSSGP